VGARDKITAGVDHRRLENGRIEATFHSRAELRLYLDVTAAVRQNGQNAAH